MAEVNTNATLLSSAENIADVSSITNNGEVKISEGTLSKTIGGKKLTFAAGANNSAEQTVEELNVEGAFSNSNNLTVSKTLTNSGTITNTGKLTLSGGSATTPMVNGGTIEGAGELAISGNTQNNSSITQGTLTVTESGKLTNTSNLTVNTALNNSGEIANNSQMNVNATTTNGGKISGTDKPQKFFTIRRTKK